MGRVQIKHTIDALYSGVFFFTNLISMRRLTELQWRLKWQKPSLQQSNLLANKEQQAT